MTNPLNHLSRPLPFDKIQTRHVRPGIIDEIAEAEKALQEIADARGKNWESTFGAFDTATENLEVAMGVVEHLEAVATTDEFRQAYNDVLPKVSAFWSSIPLRQDLFESLSSFRDSEQAKSLSPIQDRFVVKTLDEFKRSGANLDEAGKSNLTRIDQELSQLTTQFSQNVLDGTNEFEYFASEEEIAGLPQSARLAAREAAQAKGQTGYRFSLQAPSVVAILTYAENRSLREKIWHAFNTRGVSAGRDNLGLINKIIKLRQEKAKLLGFRNFADLVTEDRMAHDAATAQEFVERLKEKTLPAFQLEKNALLEFARRREDSSDLKLEPWDVGFYAEKMRKELYDFDEEALKPYFSADAVLRGAFELAEQLFQVRVESADLPTWHPSVGSHRILDSNGELLGEFYTDLFPRESKRDGAWMHGLVAAKRPDVHVALFCANAQPPTENQPSLMSFRDVETIFHEFGHLLHHCLSQVPLRSLACTRVAQDFVELPSQILENWCLSSEMLNQFAHHFETGDTVPQELVSKLLEARNFRAASAQMRQLGFAAVDLALHTHFDPKKDGSVGDFSRRILQEYAPTELPKDYAMIASFGHLFSHSVGYAAGYYSYKWAEVLDADAFSRFQKEGIFNEETGRAFRDLILSQGDALDPLILFQEFMGRSPDPDAMMIRQGLLAKA
ncbi:MAG: M3 family metallopeptidase [Polyangiaceae bacterium]|nr:M3 family metallopeptidase [Polyangiaceae bacterium]